MGFHWWAGGIEQKRNVPVAVQSNSKETVSTERKVNCRAVPVSSRRFRDFLLQNHGFKRASFRACKNYKSRK